MIGVIGAQADGPIRRGMTLHTTNEVAGLVVLPGSFWDPSAFILYAVVHGFSSSLSSEAEIKQPSNK